MDTLQSLLEKDKGRFVTELSREKEPARAVKVLEDQVDRILYQFNEQETDEKTRAQAASLLKSLKSACPLVDSVGETRVYERSIQRGPEDAKKMSRGHIFLCTGAGVFAAGVLITNSPAGKSGAGSILATILCFGIAVLLFFLAGGEKARQSGIIRTKEEQHTENLVDPEKLYRTLRASCLLIDKILEDLKGQERYEKSVEGLEPSDEISQEELLLFSELLEALYLKDGSYALERLDQIRFYLHRKHVELLDYSSETENYFDVMPSLNKGTIRPAMVSDGKLLKKGLAAGGR